jgi:acetyl esterase/lipase
MNRSPRRRRLVLGVAAILCILGGVAAAALLRGLPAPSAAAHYATASPSEQLDLYLPAGKGPFPVVIYIHGGAFRFGDKREHIGGLADDIRRLHAEGIAIASINYRMSGEAPFPAAVADTKAAIRWLRSHAQELGIEPTEIGLWGKSAGANLALMAGLTGGDSTLYDAKLGMTDVSDHVQAVVSMYAPTDFLTMDRQLLASPCSKSAAGHDKADSPESVYIGAPIQQSQELARHASPISQVSAAAPPTLLQAGTADCVVPGAQSQELFDALLPLVGAERVKLMMLPGATHADSMFDAAANLDVVAQFLRTHLRGTSASGSATGR